MMLCCSPVAYFVRFTFFSLPCCHDCGNYPEGAITLLSGHKRMGLLLKAKEIKTSLAVTNSIAGMELETSRNQNNALL